MIVREYGLDASAGRALHSLFEMRFDADYDREPVPPDEARAAIAAATACVDAVATWLADRS